MAIVIDYDGGRNAPGLRHPRSLDSPPTNSAMLSPEDSNSTIASREDSPYSSPSSDSVIPYPDVNGFRALHEEELMNRPPRRCILAGLIPERGLVLLFGVPKTKKSFVAQDICYHISLGRPWAGREVIQGCTVFAAGERTDSLGDRLKAWIEVHKPEGRVGIKYVERVPDLMKLASVDAFIRALRHIDTPISLVVLDTLARCTVGIEENAAREMSVAMSNADRIRSELNCAVLIIHHSNRAGTGERGSGVARAAVDVVLKVEAVGSDRVVVHLDASNDLPDADDIVFEVIPAGSSCALRHFGGARVVAKNPVKLVSCHPTLVLVARLARQAVDGRIERKALVRLVTKGTLNRHLTEGLTLGLLEKNEQGRYSLTSAGSALVADDEVSLAA